MEGMLLGCKLGDVEVEGALDGWLEGLELG